MCEIMCEFEQANHRDMGEYRLVGAEEIVYLIESLQRWVEI